MGIDLCRLHTRVPKKFLDGADVVARLDHVRGERVSEGMAAPGLRYPGRPDRRLDRLLQGRLRDVMPLLTPRARVE